MPVGKCLGCGYQTNSATSNWWFVKDQQPTECYARWDGGWVQGCAYDKADEITKKTVDAIIRRGREE